MKKFVNLEEKAHLFTFKEAIRKNLGKIYYHGSKSNNLIKEKKRFSYFFISESIFYAMKFSLNPESCNYGCVFKLQFKKPLNIFDARFPQDLFKLNKLVDLSEKETIILKERDWLDLGYERRKYIFNKLQELNFDGFFNFENFREDEDTDFKANPSLGILNINNLNFLEKITFDDYFKESKKFERKFKQAINSFVEMSRQFILTPSLKYTYNDNLLKFLSKDLEYKLTNTNEEVLMSKDYLEKNIGMFEQKAKEVLKPEKLQERKKKWEDRCHNYGIKAKFNEDHFDAYQLLKLTQEEKEKYINYFKERNLL